MGPVPKMPETGLFQVNDFRLTTTCTMLCWTHGEPKCKPTPSGSDETAYADRSTTSDGAPGSTASVTGDVAR
jgi:hypothetical protein